MNAHQKVDDELIKKVPALAAYAKSVDAEPTNFRHYVVREPDENGYRRDVGSFRVDAEGNVLIFRNVKPPTEAQAAAIKAEVLAVGWPHSIHASHLRADLQAAPKEHVCVFQNEAGNEIIFVQYRRDGQKPDLPFSYWSDGDWRCMEPDGGLLPLYGLEQLKDHWTLFLHEGAKAARNVRWMIKNNNCHPWMNHLKHAAHLGWPGGASNSWRVDWGPIKRLPMGQRIVLVCDNDQIGKRAAREISQELQRKLEVVFFDDSFPESFDLADEFPKNMFDEFGNYRGPRFEDCVRSGTWATKVTDKIVTLRPEFVDEWRFAVEPPLFFNRVIGSATYTDAAFNRLVRSFSDSPNTAALMLTHVEAQVDGVTYDPSSGCGIVNADRRSMINVYRPSSIRPRDMDVSLFSDFMNGLISDKNDLEKVLKWIATLIARPDVRMLYGVLLISEAQGVGKGTLMEKILAPLVGWHNVSVPNEKQVTDSAFNSWIANRRLILVHEIYAGDSKKAYNNIKSVITDKKITVNAKYQPEYELTNWAHFVCASNSRRALTMVAEDRRWLVPQVGENKQDAAYWTKLNDWLTTGGGLEGIAFWAKKYVLEKDAVGPGDTAPSTEAKEQLIRDSLSPGRLLLREWGPILLDPPNNFPHPSNPQKDDRPFVPPKDFVLPVSDITAALARLGKAEHATTVGQELRRAGLKTRPLGHANLTHVVKAEDDRVKKELEALVAIGQSLLKKLEGAEREKRPF